VELGEIDAVEKGILLERIHRREANADRSFCLFLELILEGKSDELPIFGRVEDERELDRAPFLLSNSSEDGSVAKERIARLEAIAQASARKGEVRALIASDNERSSSELDGPARQPI